MTEVRPARPSVRQRTRHPHYDAGLDFQLQRIQYIYATEQLHAAAVAAFRAIIRWHKPEVAFDPKYPPIAATPVVLTNMGRNLGLRVSMLSSNLFC